MLRCNMMDLDKSSRDMIFSAHSNLSICSADQDSREAINVSKLYDLAVLEEAVLLHSMFRNLVMAAYLFPSDLIFLHKSRNKKKSTGGCALLGWEEHVNSKAEKKCKVLRV